MRRETQLVIVGFLLVLVILTVIPKELIAQEESDDSEESEEESEPEEEEEVSDEEFEENVDRSYNYEGESEITESEIEEEKEEDEYIADIEDDIADAEKDDNKEDKERAEEEMEEAKERLEEEDEEDYKELNVDKEGNIVEPDGAEYTMNEKAGDYDLDNEQDREAWEKLQKDYNKALEENREKELDAAAKEIAEATEHGSWPTEQRKKIDKKDNDDKRHHNDKTKIIIKDDDDDDKIIERYYYGSNTPFLEQPNRDNSERYLFVYNSGYEQGKWMRKYHQPYNDESPFVEHKDVEIWYKLGYQAGWNYWDSVKLEKPIQ